MHTIHRNGGGAVYDYAEVSKSAYLSPESEARHTATVRYASIFGRSRIWHDARIFGGRICDSTIGQNTVVTGSPTIDSSVVCCRDVSGTPHILRSILLDGVEIADSARLTDVVLGSGVMVYGTAELVGPWQLEGRARILAGRWERPPMVYNLMGGTYVVTEGADGYVSVNCNYYHIDRWLKGGHRYGRRRGWNDQQIAELESVLRAWHPIMLTNG